LIINEALPLYINSGNKILKIKEMKFMKQTKQFTAILLVMAMILTMIPINSYAEEIMLNAEVFTMDVNV